jgi:hypothetical protein
MRGQAKIYRQRFEVRCAEMGHNGLTSAFGKALVVLISFLDPLVERDAADKFLVVNLLTSLCLCAKDGSTKNLENLEHNPHLRSINVVWRLQQ